MEEDEKEKNGEEEEWRIKMRGDDDFCREWAKSVRKNGRFCPVVTRFYVGIGKTSTTTAETKDRKKYRNLRRRVRRVWIRSKLPIEEFIALEAALKRQLAKAEEEASASCVTTT